MPLYEYQCQQCQRRVEKIQKFSDAPLTTCPHCGGELERTLTAPAVQFKGGGWYNDLYSSAKPAPAAGAADAKAPAAASGGGEGSAGAGAAGGGGESKPGAPASPAPSSAPAGSSAGSGS